MPRQKSPAIQAPVSSEKMKEKSSSPLAQAYKNLRRAEKQISNMIASGASLLLSSFFMEIIFKWQKPVLHHILRDELAPAEVSLLTPDLKNVWILLQHLKDLAQMNTYTREALPLPVEITAKEAGAAFQLLDFLARFPREELVPSLKEVLFQNGDIQKALQICRDIRVRGNTLESVYKYFKSGEAGVHPASVITFFASHIDPLFLPISEQIRSQLQSKGLKYLGQQSFFILGNILAPLVFNAILLRPVRLLTEWFRPASIPHNDFELKTALAAPKEVQEKMIRDIQAQAESLSRKATAGKRLAFWVSALSVAASSTYFLFRAPLNAVIMAGSAVVTLPVVNKIPRLAKSIFARGQEFCRRSWHYLTNHDAEQECNRLAKVLDNRFECSLEHRKVDDVKQLCFKISLGNIRAKAFHIAQVLSLLLLEQGLHVNEITHDAVYVKEQKLSEAKLAGLGKALADRLGKIQDSEELLLLIKKYSPLVLISLERNYDTGIHRVVLQARTEAQATILSKCFSQINSDQAWDIFSLELTSENRQPFEACLKSFKVVPDDLSSSGAIQSQFDLGSRRIRRIKREKPQGLEEKEMPVSSVDSSQARAAAHHGGQYIFSTNFDRRSLKQYGEICERVEKDIAEDKVSIVRAQNATGAKLYGGKFGVFVPGAGIFNVAYKIPSTKLRVWGTIERQEDGIHITFQKVARSENIKSLG